MNKLDTAKQIYEKAIEAHQPKYVFNLLSGGHDSLSITHFIQSYFSGVEAVIHIDTGIGIPETQEFVKKVCSDFGWTLKIYRSVNNINAKGEPDPQIYEDLVKKFGFPGAYGHGLMYQRLKERQIGRICRDYNAKPKTPIMFISGGRRHESARRMKTFAEPVQDKGRMIWCAPFFDFTEDDQAEYMENHQLPRNPVKDILGMSGECLCGAYAKEGELDRIRKHYPDVANRIEALENEVIAAGFPWGWEDSVPAWYTKKKLMDNFGQEDFFDIERDEVLSDQGFQPLCTTCNYNGSL